MKQSLVSKLSLLRCYQRVPSQFHKSTATFKYFHCISSTQLLQPRVPLTSQARTFWESFPFIRPLFYEKDGLDRRRCELIYHSKSFYFTFYGQLLAISSFAAQIGAGLYYGYIHFFSDKAADLITEIGPYPIYYNLSSLVILCLFNLQFALMVYSARTSVLRIYYVAESDKFIVVTLALNPFKSELFACNPGELVLLEEKHFNFLFGNHKLRNKRIFIGPHHFKEIAHYNQMIARKDTKK